MYLLFSAPPERNLVLVCIPLPDLLLENFPEPSPSKKYPSPPKPFSTPSAQDLPFAQDKGVAAKISSLDGVYMWIFLEVLACPAEETYA